MNIDPKEDIQHIRQMMERSSRFISLSGLSGIFAGVAALAGVLFAYCILKENDIANFCESYSSFPNNVLLYLSLLAIAILAVAIAGAVFFTIRKSKNHQLAIWTASTKSLLWSLIVPLIAGGVFCIAAVYYASYGFIAPAMLIFYGLGLVNASKFTYSDIQYLGYCEIILGLVSLFFWGYGLIFWAVGFGIIHILYGLIMYKKYK